MGAFTLQGHTSGDEALPPVGHRNPKHIPGSSANYWELDEDVIANMQQTVQALDPTVPVFKEPHAMVTGVVDKVEPQEKDGDHHFWLTIDSSTPGEKGKMRLACEITPQQKIPVPNAGMRVRVFGIWRYDLQHAWWEIHPVDYIEEAANEPSSNSAAV